MSEAKPYQLEAWLNYAGLIHGFSVRGHNNMSFLRELGDARNVVQNREAFLTQLRVRLDDCYLMVVNDTADVQVVTTRDRGRNMRQPSKTTEGDAAITRENNLFLVMVTADCLPIMFYHPESLAVGMMHGSWKMIGEQLISRVVKRFEQEFGIPATELLIGIGPGIHKESYRIKNPKQTDSPAWQPYLETQPDGTTSIDLVQYTADQLTTAGIPQHQITISPIDTAAHAGFFSHHRSKYVTNEPEARFASVIGVRHPK
jgi:copper oxidase (laccase) domain-containing protein